MTYWIGGRQKKICRSQNDFLNITPVYLKKLFSKYTFTVHRFIVAFIPLSIKSLGTDRDFVALQRGDKLPEPCNKLPTSAKAHLSR